MTVSKRARRGKYNNHPMEVDGYRFDSEAEIAFYRLVRDMVSRGEVVRFEVHPRYVIVPTQKKFGSTIRQATYSPDFYLLYADGSEEWIEVKGSRGIISDDSRLKMKVFNHMYPLRKLRIWTPKNGFLA